MSITPIQILWAVPPNSSANNIVGSGLKWLPARGNDLNGQNAQTPDSRAQPTAARGFAACTYRLPHRPRQQEFDAVAGRRATVNIPATRISFSQVIRFCHDELLTGRHRLGWQWWEHRPGQPP